MVGQRKGGAMDVCIYIYKNKDHIIELKIKKY